MKKILLSASLLMLSASAFAVTDGQTYEPKEGLTVENLWVFDRFHTLTEYEANPICNKAARTATTDGKVIYVGLSGDVATIEKFSVETGEYLGSLALTLNGEAFAGTLAANSVGFDEYGHFYVATYAANSDGAGNYNVYLADLKTGALTSVGELLFDGGTGRVDYCDVIGDLTGKESNATVLAVSSDAANLNVFQWFLAKGTTEWQGGWNGSTYQSVVGTYPKDQAGFSSASVCKMVRPSDDGKLGLFYIDGFTTLPALYDNNATLVDSFENVDVIKKDEEGNVVSGTVVEPAIPTNGIAESNVGGKNMIIYSEGQYDGTHTCQAVITTVNDDMEFASMKQLWVVPADGLGQVSDGGVRFHGLDRIELPADANGKTAFLLVTFKCFNGLGVYKIAEEGYGSVADNVVSAAATINVNGDVIAVSAPAESIEVYNVAGQKVAQVENASEIAAPVSGLYVVKAVVDGAPVVKKVIVK